MEWNKNKTYKFSHHFDIVNTGETPYKHINKHIRRPIWKERISFLYEIVPIFLTNLIMDSVAINTGLTQNYNWRSPWEGSRDPY